MSTYDATSRLVFKQSLARLIREAKAGDEDSFFKILQIDRTVVECEWAKKMIRKAQLKGNNEFFDKMAKAITTPPLDNRRLYDELLMILLTFWNFGLRRLKNNELIELLEDSGLRVQQDPEVFRKFINREIKPAFKEDIISFN